MDPFQIRVIHKSYPLLHTLEASENQINQTVNMVAKAVYLKGICLHLPQWTGSKFGI